MGTGAGTATRGGSTVLGGRGRAAGGECGSARLSLGVPSKVTAGRRDSAEQMEVAVGPGRPGAQRDQGTPALCPGTVCASWRPSSHHRL